MIHYGGDSGLEDTYRKGTLYFFNNTVIVQANQSSGDNARWRTLLFDLPTAGETLDFRDNIVHVTPETSGELATTVSLLEQTGNAIVGKNFVSAAFVKWRDNEESAGTGSIQGWENLIEMVRNDAGFVAFGDKDFRLTADSLAVDEAEASIAEHPVTDRYAPHGNGLERILSGAAPDLGAFEKE